MARLTEKEKKNLSRNLKGLTYSTDVKLALCSATGIKQRTYETYLYGERGASPKALKLIADFFQTTPEMLVSKNKAAEEAKQRNYYHIWLDRTTTNDEQILEFIRQNFGTRGKEGKILYSFLTLIEAADFKIRIRPDYSDEEVIAYHKAISGRNENIYEIREEQYDAKYDRSYPLRLKGEKKKKFDEISATPEFRKLKELMVSDGGATVKLTVKQEQFIKKAKNWEYSETSLRDLPLTFIITQTKDKIDLNEMESMEDIYSIIAEVPIADMLAIQKKFLKEPFEDADDFLDFIYNTLAKYKV